MTMDQWVSKYLGKGIDYDGAYGVQCVDLAKSFAANVLGITPKAVGDAHCYYDDYNKYPYLYNNFDRIANTPAFVPKKGDLVVWSAALNGNWGHIAVATGEGNTNTFKSYDQNWNGRHDPMTKITHNYNYVRGVLRPKNQKNITGSTSSNTSTSSGTPFLVKVNTATLNVRAGAGTNYKKTTQVHSGEVYTIVQTAKNGGYTWGKLKSGAGWIALEYTKRV